MSNGIFDKPTALGFLGLGSEANAPCQGVAFYKDLQAELRKRGYAVRQDGIWDGCCQNALLKELGTTLVTTTQVRQFLGRGCSSGYVDPGGILVAGPQHSVPPTCPEGTDKQGTTPGAIPQCPSGQIYDITLGRCVPTADPYNCGKTCDKFPSMSAEWAKCLLECNASGGNMMLPPGPTPVPPVPVVDPVEPSAMEVLGDNLPLIMGALAVGVTATVYFATRPKKRPTTALSNKRKRRKKGRKGRR